MMQYEQPDYEAPDVHDLPTADAARLLEEILSSMTTADLITSLTEHGIKLVDEYADEIMEAYNDEQQAELKAMWEVEAQLAAEQQRQMELYWQQTDKLLKLERQAYLLWRKLATSSDARQMKLERKAYRRYQRRSVALLTY